MRLNFRRQRDETGPFRWPTSAIVFAVLVSVATAMLIMVGYVAAREWKRGTTLLLESRRAAMLMMASAALNRDMRGAWTTVLAPFNPALLDEDPPIEIMRLTANAFARFPYPESFLIARSRGGQTTVDAFNRTDRPPFWETSERIQDALPVVGDKNPPALMPIVAQARREGTSGTFISVRTAIDGQPYLLIGRLIGAAGSDASTLVAFTVNEQWVRAHYFGPLLEQVSRIGQTEPSVVLAVRDPQNRLVSATAALPDNVPSVTRTFPLLFMDPAAMSLPAAERLNLEEWKLQVATAVNNQSTAAQTAPFQLFFLMALAGLVSTVALVMTLRAVRASVRLSSMRADFVAAVTHDLKTPVALVRLVGDTLANRRYSTPETVDQYARLLSHAAARLSRSIDNLLIYSRYTEAGNLSGRLHTPLQLADLVEAAVEPFRPAINQKELDISIDVPYDLPPVMGERQALVQVIETLVDNAVKYTHPRTQVRIVGTANGLDARLTVTDQGIGIPERELGRVFERFFRATNATERGSGLGLTIAHRILAAHQGSIQIQSTLNAGTTAVVMLPIGARAQADSGSSSSGTLRGAGRGDAPKSKGDYFDVAEPDDGGSQTEAV